MSYALLCSQLSREENTPPLVVEVEGLEIIVFHLATLRTRDAVGGKYGLWGWLRLEMLGEQSKDSHAVKLAVQLRAGGDGKESSEVRQGQAHVSHLPLQLLYLSSIVIFRYVFNALVGFVHALTDVVELLLGRASAVLHRDGCLLDNGDLLCDVNKAGLADD
jgi:hypothetical protein